MSFVVKDHYFNEAKKHNFVARSVFKLEEIDKKFSLLHPKMKVLDLGYFPGSWVQYLSKKVGAHGKVVGMDLQEERPIPDLGRNTTLLQGDIFEMEKLEDFAATELFDVICSDMAPKTTGIKMVDQAQSLNLVEKIFHLLPLVLREDGHLVMKCFESNDVRNFLNSNKKRFKSISYFRPKSTRSCSFEFFVIAKGFVA